MGPFGGESPARVSLDTTTKIRSPERGRLATPQAVTADGTILVWGQPFELRTVLRLRRTVATSGRGLAKLLLAVNAWLAPTGERGEGTPFGNAPLPTPIAGLPPAERAVAVSCGAGVTAVRCASGALYMFGLNVYGQLGIEVETRQAWTPTRVLGALSPVKPLPIDHETYKVTSEV
jgi:hypothetical protein